MGANQSYLSNNAYQYDFVVATTQASVNVTMKEYLSKLNAPEVIRCYVYDDNNQPKLIDYNTLLQQAGVTDLFTIPNATSPTDQRLAKLANVGFAYAFKAKIGLPPGYAPTQIPDVVTLHPSAGSVTFNLMCSEFMVVELTYGPRNQNTWLNQSQAPGNAWLFTSNVMLSMLTVGSEEYNKLPPDVQKQIDNLGSNAFSVQQLLFDLDNAALESVPTIQGVKPGTPLYTALETVFLGAYFQQMKQSGQPVLGYTVAQNNNAQGSLTLTSFELESSSFVGNDGIPVSSPTPQQAQAQTLCYLCAAGGDTLRPAAQFNWNWVDLSEASQHDGVMSINRNTLANYIASQLDPMLPRNCFNPWVRVSMDGLDVDYQWSLTSGQTPARTNPASGPFVLTYNWSSPQASDEAGLGGDMGGMKLSSSLGVTVAFQGNTIVITQTLMVYAYIRVMQTSGSGNIVNKTITDTYTLAVDQNGQLKATLSSTTADNSDNPSTNPFLNFFTGLNDLINDIKNWTRSFVSTSFTSLPIGIVQGFVFPGGNTFTFSDVSFSNNQDMVAHINYVQPTSQYK